jgi:hypothetical protein
MKQWALFCLGGLVLFVWFCEKYSIIVDRQQLENQQKLVLSLQDENKKLKDALSIANQANRYQVVREGYRTFRLDTSTGATCLLFTTEYDWKHDAKDLSCANVDQSNPVVASDR